MAQDAGDESVELGRKKLLVGRGELSVEILLPQS